MKNFWSGRNCYRGINDVQIARTNLLPVGDLYFEVQYHTPESLAAKNSVHGSKYTIFRDANVSPHVKLKVWKELAAIADTVPLPPGGERLPTPIVRPPPLVPTGSHESTWSRIMGCCRPCLRS